MWSPFLSLNGKKKKKKEGRGGAQPIHTSSWRRLLAPFSQLTLNRSLAPQTPLPFYAVPIPPSWSWSFADWGSVGSNDLSSPSTQRKESRKKRFMTGSMKYLFQLSDFHITCSGCMNSLGACVSPSWCPWCPAASSPSTGQRSRRDQYKT